MWLEAASTALTAAEFARGGWKFLERFRERGRRTLRLMTHGRLTLPLFGAGGVGKTTLAQILAGQLDPFTGPTDYRESLVVKHFKITTKAKRKLAHVPGVLIDIPGQERRVPETWPQLFDDFLAPTRADRIGLINVVAHGLHSLDADTPALDEVAAYQGLTAAQRRDAYFAGRRDRELVLCRLLIDALLDRADELPAPLWMLTVVTKQDLWWPQRKDVHAHYEGEYLPIVDRLRERLGPERFQHEFADATLLSTNLTEHAGRPLAEVAKGYDQTLRTRSLDNLLSTLESLTGADA